MVIQIVILMKNELDVLIVIITSFSDPFFILSFDSDSSLLVFDFFGRSKRERERERELKGSSASFKHIILKNYKRGRYG